MKTVISVRLSEERLSEIDEVGRRLGLNRSQVIDVALRVLPEIISGQCEYRYKPKALFAPERRRAHGKS